MNPLRNAGINVSLRECSLPPEDLPQHVNDVVDARRKSSHKKRHKDGKRKKEKKKKSDKRSGKEKKSKRPDQDIYQEIPTESSSSREKERKKQDHHRAIPESLTGREISWSRSYLKDAEELLFHEDLIKAPKSKSHRRHRRRKPCGEVPPIQEVRLDVSEEPKIEEAPQNAILLDPDGFPIQKNDFVKAASTPAHKFDESVTSAEKSHAGSHFHDSLASQVDSHIELHGSCASTEKSRIDSLVQDSMASTERSLLPSHPATSSAGGDLHKYFQKHGHDEMAAINTAAAFEAFLRQQHEMTSDKVDSDHSTTSWSCREDLRDSSSDDSDDPFSHSKYCWGSESTVFPCNDEDIKAFQEDTPNNDEWSPFGIVRRNEAFVKRVSSQDLVKSTSEGTLRSSVLDTHSTTRTDRSFLTTSTLATKESPPGKVVPPGKALRAVRRPANLAPLVSTRSLDAIVPHERSVERQLASLSLSQRSCVNALKTRWEKYNGVNHWFPDEYYLRFARCSPGDPFNLSTGWKVMTRFDWRYYELSISKMEACVLTKVSLGSHRIV